MAAMSRVAPSAAHEGRASNVPVHFIYHVPKCAGQTIDGHFSSVLPDSAYYKTAKRHGPGRFVFTRHDFRKLPDLSATKVVAGHFLGISLDAQFAGRLIKRSLLLRDPVGHALSYYNFRMMRYLSRGYHPYSFDVAYGAMHRNFITHYILRHFLEMSWARVAALGDEDKYDIVNAFLSKFWYVADYRLCDDLIGAIGTQLGIDGRAVPKNTQAQWERHVRWKSLELGDLSPGTIARIENENLIDQRLWETWRNARNDVAHVRPRALAGLRATGFITDEAVRFVNQIARRVQRRWGQVGGPEIPAPASPAEGSSAIPV
jgi:hypothetical protein